MKLFRYFEDWNWFERIWLFAFTALNIYLFFLWDDTWIGLIASLTGMMSVILDAKGKMSNYYYGFINIIAYAYVSFENRYYGDFMLNAFYYLPMQFIGIFTWRRKLNKNKTIIVKKMSLVEKLVWLLLTIDAIYLYGLFLQYINGRAPFTDSATVVLSVIAMILLVRRAPEQWILWIVADVISIYLWVKLFLQDGSNISMVIMWTAFLINAVYGYYNWLKLGRENDK